MRPKTTFSGPELCALTATQVVALLRKRELSSADLIDAALARINAVEPLVNATVTLCEDRARQASANLERSLPLGGLPIGIKDLNDVAGVRTTYGTKGLANNVPSSSDPLVTRLEDRGAVVLGKTNTPEMGAGGNTFNDVFGRTRNVWNTSRNAGGSSGGAAVSLATGEFWLSHGSDHGGSLRTPASFNSIVGLRPSPGTAGGGSAMLGFVNGGLDGPMARNVTDCALFLDMMSGFDPIWPLSFPAPETPYAETVAQQGPAPRIAFSPTLNGFGEVEADISNVLEQAMIAVARSGAVVEGTCPDLSNLEKTYRILRGFSQAAQSGSAPKSLQSHFKADLADNIAQGKLLGLDDLISAEYGRSALYDSVHKTLANFDVIACAVTGIAAGPVSENFPKSVNGKATTDYIDWLRFAFLATTCGLPAMSLPVGFTQTGMPVGIQLIGRSHGEARLLQVARFIENVLDLPAGPIDPIAR